MDFFNTGVKYVTDNIQGNMGYIAIAIIVIIFLYYTFMYYGAPNIKNELFEAEAKNEMIEKYRLAFDFLKTFEGVDVDDSIFDEAVREYNEYLNDENTQIQEGGEGFLNFADVYSSVKDRVGKLKNRVGELKDRVGKLNIAEKIRNMIYLKRFEMFRGKGKSKLKAKMSKKVKQINKAVKKALKSKKVNKVMAKAVKNAKKTFRAAKKAKQDKKASAVVGTMSGTVALAPTYAPSEVDVAYAPTEAPVEATVEETPTDTPVETDTPVKSTVEVSENTEETPVELTPVQVTQVDEEEEETPDVQATDDEEAEEQAEQFDNYLAQVYHPLDQMIAAMLNQIDYIQNISSEEERKIEVNKFIKYLSNDDFDAFRDELNKDIKVETFETFFTYNISGNSNGRYVR